VECAKLLDRAQIHQTAGAGVASAVRSSPLGPLLAVAGVNLENTKDGVTVAGPLAALARRAAYLWRQPTDAQKLRVGQSWLEALSASAQNPGKRGGAGSPSSH
jgi:hypothetical protein